MTNALYHQAYDNDTYLAIREQVEKGVGDGTHHASYIMNTLIDTCFQRTEGNRCSESEGDLWHAIRRLRLNWDAYEAILDSVNKYLERFNPSVVPITPDPVPEHFEPVPLSIEQATHLFKHVCTPSQLADLQDGLDAIIAVLTEVNGLDYYITRQAKSELETLAAALHTITDEPTVQFEGTAYQIVVPSTPNDTQPVTTSPDDDDLSWLDPFRPDAP
ncbi:MAG: hypothetical protein KF716_23430 [Anaerolineae bacterium]|nr:hypothetical protein [Anaerolineae bacterium]